MRKDVGKTKDEGKDSIIARDADVSFPEEGVVWKYA
jgi:hypothetical protein